MIIRIPKKARSVIELIREAVSVLFVFIIFLSLGLISPASAALFTTTLSSGPDTFQDSYDSVDDAFDQLTSAQLQAALPSYTDNSAAAGLIDYRGLPMNFTFTANSPFLTMTIPALGITEVFMGATRDESKDLLVEYLEGDGASTVDQIQEELARVSPIDPVAGNPGSLMGQLVNSDFDLATSTNHFQFAATPGGMALISKVMPKQTALEDVASRSASLSEMSESSAAMGESGGEAMGEDESRYDAAETFENELQSPGGVFGVDLSHRSLDLEGEKSNTETITIDYEYYFEDPLKVVRVKMPLAITDTEGATTYHANVGVDFSYPVTRSWSLTPGLSYGVGGSEDLGGGASINGLSLTSTYRWVYGDYLYTMGNMVGRYQTGSVSLGDYEINPDISNTVFRNGLVVFRPSILFGAPTMVQVFAIDTRYSGDELFTEHYYEVGFALGLITDESLISEDTFNLGLTYLDATDADIKGYKINFGYRF